MKKTIHMFPDLTEKKTYGQSLKSRHSLSLYLEIKRKKYKKLKNTENI